MTCNVFSGTLNPTQSIILSTSVESLLVILKYSESLWPPYEIGQAIIFCPVVSFYLLPFFARLISAVGDWMPTILPPMV